MIRKLGLWMPLDKDDEEAILSLPHRIKKLAPHQYIVRDGEKPVYSCLLLSGFAFRHKVAGDGGRQIMSIHMKGDVVDLQNSLLRRSDHNVQALTSIEVAFIPIEAVQKVAFERPTVGRAMWYETLVDASIFREWTLNVGRRDSLTRTAHLLCEFALRLETAGLGEQCAYELPMTQDQLADALGLTNVHVNRTLKALDARNLIERTQRSVKILDWKQLAALGDFDSNYLHLDE
ncbi:MAG: Crp/Fnr family transcriptional regulator [Alphaproteobacteria bacterium]|nr:Crp/Fnr family transcriptional regulator [Alphaproteobacteria bacterium]